MAQAPAWVHQEGGELTKRGPPELARRDRLCLVRERLWRECLTAVARGLVRPRTSRGQRAMTRLGACLRPKCHPLRGQSQYGAVEDRGVRLRAHLQARRTVRPPMANHCGPLHTVYLSQTRFVMNSKKTKGSTTVQGPL